MFRVIASYTILLWIENKQLLVRTRTYFYSQSDITNQAHSTPLFNALVTGRRLLVMEIHKPKTN